ncbi:hypothetical protein [Vibrio spartinae]|uniref:Glycosyl transferase family 2 n=1 Tax=Vibrio spartinae TaxID=1918945 RepID=A0A1N6M8F7_9VIBR|nr:hypothetical protein [Vibrio spartinae]SIO95738.1 hypothetical protein VSP9026_03490 [Vibrio spartinae]
MKCDIVFISYDEPCAESNWMHLKKRFPDTKRVHGVNGILKSHKVASETVTTEWFFVVDGDNKVRDDFNFDLPVEPLCSTATYVWRSVNSVNGLCYGNGGVKLFNKKLFQGVKHFSGDMTISLSPDYRIVNVVASDTVINTSNFHSWRAAFRECIKLSIPRKNLKDDIIRKERLTAWSLIDTHIDFGDWISIGAIDAAHFYQENIDNIDFMLSMINDFKWLRDTFNLKYVHKNNI